MIRRLGTIPPSSRPAMQQQFFHLWFKSVSIWLSGCAVVTPTFGSEFKEPGHFQFASCPEETSVRECDPRQWNSYLNVITGLL
jgi:hypothetical protein